MIRYPIAVLDRAELSRYLSAGEVDRLTDEDMRDIAAAMQKELRELGFWEQLVFIAKCTLIEKGNSHERTV
jgi:hypothetical protein